MRFLLRCLGAVLGGPAGVMLVVTVFGLDRKSTRLNSSHLVISYAVFCLKKKKYKHASLRLIHTPDLKLLYALTDLYDSMMIGVGNEDISFGKYSQRDQLHAYVIVDIL